MEALIKFRLLSHQLEPKEFDAFLKKIGKDEMISYIFRSFLYVHQKNPDQQHNEIININKIISDIITTRKTNTSKDTKNKTQIISDDEPDKPLKIDTLPTEMIGECASYLDLWDYLIFARCNRMLYVSCNSPSTLQRIYIADCNQSFNLNKFPLLHQIWINPSKFNKYIASHPQLKRLSHLDDVSLDNEKENDHSEMETFLNTKYIDFSAIETLQCVSFGSPQQPYDFNSFCKMLAKFPNVSKLIWIDIYLTSFDDENNKIQELLPKLKVFIYDEPEINANMFRNKLIETHSKQMVLLEYDEEETNIVTPSSLKLETISVSSPNLDSLSNLIKMTDNLQRFRLNLSGTGNVHNKRMCNIMKEIFSKYRKLNQVKFEVDDDQIEIITQYIESSTINCESIKFIWDIWYDENSTMLMEKTHLCLSRILNKLNLSKTQDFIVNCKCYGDIKSIDEQKKTAFLQRIKKTNYVVFDEIDEDANGNYQHIVISNQNCKINGYQEIRID